MLGCVQLFATPWTVAQLTSLSRGFSSQEYWSGLPFPPSGDLPDPGIKPTSPVSPTLAVGFITEPNGKLKYYFYKVLEVYMSDLSKVIGLCLLLHKFYNKIYEFRIIYCRFK